MISASKPELDYEWRRPFGFFWNGNDFPFIYRHFLTYFSGISSDLFGSEGIKITQISVLKKWQWQFAWCSVFHYLKTILFSHSLFRRALEHVLYVILHKLGSYLPHFTDKKLRFREITWLTQGHTSVPIKIRRTHVSWLTAFQPQDMKCGKCTLLHSLLPLKKYILSSQSPWDWIWRKHVTFT